MLTMRVLCIALLVGLAISAVECRPRGRRPGGHRRPRKLGFRACLLTDADTEEVLREHACQEGQTCSLGPLDLEGRDDQNLTALFCSVTPTADQPRPGVLRAACLIETDEAILEPERECPPTSECENGPIEYTNEDGVAAYAYFCTKPMERPDHSRESSEEEDSVESSEEEDSVESSEEETEEPATPAEQRGPRGFRARREKRWAGRGGRSGRGGRGGRFGGRRGCRRPRSLLSYACSVTDGEDVHEKACHDEAPCTLGPLSLEGRDNTTLTAYFCQVELTEEDLLQGVVAASCLIESQGEETPLHERECPETTECGVGPLNLALGEDTINAYFCTKPEEHDDSSEEEGRRHQGRRGRDSSEEDEDEDDDDDIVVVPPQNPEGPELPEGPEGPVEPVDPVDP